MQTQLGKMGKSDHKQEMHIFDVSHMVRLSWQTNKPFACRCVVDVGFHLMMMMMMMFKHKLRCPVWANMRCCYAVQSNTATILLTLLSPPIGVRWLHCVIGSRTRQRERRREREREREREQQQKLVDLEDNNKMNVLPLPRCCRGGRQQRLAHCVISSDDVCA